MSRGIAIVFTFGLLGAALIAGWYSNRQTLYFPPELNTTVSKCVLEGQFESEGIVLDKLEAFWLSDELADLGEPSLYQRALGSPRAVRLIWLAGSPRPMIVRLEARQDGRWTITARTLSPLADQQGTEGTSLNEVVRPLSVEERESFEQLLEQSDLMASPSSGCRGAPDALSVIIETFDPDEGYRYAHRQEPWDGPVFDLGTFMYGLAGWDY